MSQNLPAIQVQVSLSDRAAIKNFLDELEAVAQSCTVVSTPAPQPDLIKQPETKAKKENYLDDIAQKYSFAPPRTNFYKSNDPSHSGAIIGSPKNAQNCPTPKSIVPSGIMWQFNKTCKALLSSISTIQRKQ